MKYCNLIKKHETTPKHRVFIPYTKIMKDENWNFYLTSIILNVIDITKFIFTAIDFSVCVH